MLEGFLESAAKLELCEMPVKIAFSDHKHMNYEAWVFFRILSKLSNSFLSTRKMKNEKRNRNSVAIV